jgi:hypothetical protein
MSEEVAFIDAFIVSEKRERLKEMLSQSKRRKKMLQDLAHFQHFDRRWYKPVIQTANIESQLRQKGAPSNCHAISEDARIDGKKIALSEALKAIVGYGMGTILICIPEKLAYYEGEGPSNRGILEKDAT